MRQEKFYDEPSISEGSIKILAIGNSFSQDATYYLYQVLKDGGFDDIIITNLYISGCSLDTHYTNATSNTAAYEHQKNTNGEWTKLDNISIKSAIESEDWDYITIQQSSGSSGVNSSYGNFENLEGSALYTLKNVILTPHSAGSFSREVWRMSQYMLEESNRILNNEKAEHEVTADMLKYMA